jgi:monoamine oxidase
MSNDTCIPGDDHGVILLFLEGDQARTYSRLPAAQRREGLTAELVRHFGSAAAKPEFYVDG